MKKRPSLRSLRLPSESSIGPYLHQWDRFRRCRKFEVPSQPVRQAQRVHQRWHVDFKVEIRLKNGSLVNPCILWDPVGEACLVAFVFPAGRRKPGKQVTLEQLRSALRICFARWHILPEEVQTNHEALFMGADWDPFPSRFTLWLL
jgi:hypothetical protein